MNVAIVVKEFPPDVIGGAETQTKRMATALHDKGYDVTVFTKSYGSHDDSDVDYEVVRAWNVDLSPMISDLTFLLACLISLRRRRTEFDVLQCMMIYPIGFLGYVANRLTGIPYFAWIRGNDFYQAKDVRWKRWMIRRVLADTLVLAQSEEIAIDVESEFPDVKVSIDVLGNGVTIPDSRSDLDSRTVLYLGRLAPKKGVESLLEATADLDAPLVIVGDGPERDRLERIATDLGTEPAFEGSVHPDDVDEFYRAASVFVLPSIEGEGMPNAVLEAMAWRIPVVTTDSGGLPSIVEDGVTGYLVPMRDPDALRHRISELLEDEGLRREMGANARAYVEANHSWDRIVSELEPLYDRLQ